MCVCECVCVCVSVYVYVYVCVCMCVWETGVHAPWRGQLGLRGAVVDVRELERGRAVRSRRVRHRDSDGARGPRRDNDGDAQAVAVALAELHHLPRRVLNGVKSFKRAS
jgi:hypothetical protein